MGICNLFDEEGLEWKAGKVFSLLVYKFISLLVYS